MKTCSIYNNDQKEIYLNGFMLNVTDWCVISPATGEVAFLPSGTLYISPGHNQIWICNFLQCDWSRPQPNHWFDRERTKFDRNVAAKSAMAGMFLEEK